MIEAMTDGHDSTKPESQHILAVDLGKRLGLALYGQDGRLRWYRSKHLNNTPSMKRAIHRLLGETPGLQLIVVEGSRDLAKFWAKEAARRSIGMLEVTPERWRKALLLPRQRRDSVTAKKTADLVARRVIDWSRTSRPTSLRHDAAEAILIGLWAVLELGWLNGLPPEIHR